MAAAARAESAAMLRDASEIIKDRLYYVALRAKPTRTSFPDIHMFSTDASLVYLPFYADFGPLNLGCLYRFCMQLNEKLSDPTLPDKKILYYSSSNEQRRSNSIYLVGAYMVLYLGKTPEAVERLLCAGYSPLLPFRDASYGPSTYSLQHVDVWRGIARAVAFGWLDFATFNADEYDHYERVENGDLNWIIPGRILAFSGPHVANTYDHGYRLLTPEDYIPYFKSRNVTVVIRLNKSDYTPERFTSQGIEHVEQYFVDGGVPSDTIIRNFMRITETAPGAAAVHCKAGLGRTGTLIALYMMKHFDMEPAECIGWLRVCRPGSVIGPQQQFVHDLQPQMRRAGEAFRRRFNIASAKDEAVAQGQGVSPRRHLGSASPSTADGEGSYSGPRASLLGGTVSPSVPSGGYGAGGSAAATSTPPALLERRPRGSESATHSSSSSRTPSVSGAAYGSSPYGAAHSPYAGARYGAADLPAAAAAAESPLASRDALSRNLALRSASGKITSPGAGYDTDSMTTYATPGSAGSPASAAAAASSPYTRRLTPATSSPASSRTTRASAYAASDGPSSPSAGRLGAASRDARPSLASAALPESSLRYYSASPAERRATSRLADSAPIASAYSASRAETAAAMSAARASHAASASPARYSLSSTAPSPRRAAASSYRGLADRDRERERR